MEKNEEDQNSILLPLRKLEIVPAITSVQQEHHPPFNLNPFILRNDEPEISLVEKEKIFGPSCNCSQNSSKISTSKDFPVKNCAQFKQRKRHEFILKQPVLKTFARCIHKQQCYKESKNEVFANERNCIEKNTDSESYDGTNWSLRNDCPIDFKTLNLLDVKPCTSSDLHKSNSFRYHQSDRRPLSRNQQSPLCTPNNDRINQQNVSCSQQAMWTPTSNGDITTDELACYFETIVHIPKKMSSMAEMMYN